MNAPAAQNTEPQLLVPHFIKGRLETGAGKIYHSRDLGASFATPDTRLNDLFWPRTEPLPALNVSVAEVIEVVGGVVSPLLVVRATETSSMRNVVGSDESVAARKTSCNVWPL